MKNKTIESVSRFLLFSFLAVCVIIGFCATTTGSLLHVGGNTPGNYRTIQDAIDNASNGDTIFIFNGTYYEHVAINKTIHVIGENKNTTVIDAGGEGCVIVLYADNVNISNCTIRHSGSAFPDAGISVRSKHNTITDNNMVHNYYGIVLIRTVRNIITGNYIANNNQCGIYFSGAKYNLLTGNIVDNQPFNGFGLYDFSDGNIIVGNTLSNNHHNGINIRDSYDNNVTRNRFIENMVGLHIPPPGYHTVVDANEFFGNTVAALEEEQDFIAMSAMTYVVLIIVAFFILKKLISKKT